MLGELRRQLEEMKTTLDGILGGQLDRTSPVVFTLLFEMYEKLELVLSELKGLEGRMKR